MLRAGRTGPVGPLGTWEGRATPGGHTWDAHRGRNGTNTVHSFPRAGNSTSGTAGIEAVFDRLKDTEHRTGDVTVGDVPFGYGITSSPGGPESVTRYFAVSSY